MRAVVMHAPGDVRVEEIEAPVIVEPTDAIIRVTATCVCGSDLWPYRGIEELNGPTPMGHEYVGVVEQVGPDVNDIEVGDFVVGSFVASDNTCEICEAGFQSRCIHQVMMGSVGTQSEYARIPLADGTLVALRARGGIARLTHGTTHLEGVVALLALELVERHASHRNASLWLTVIRESAQPAPHPHARHGGSPPDR